MKKMFLSTLCLVSCLSYADDKFLDLPVIAPISPNVEMTSPSIGQIYSYCVSGSNSEETKQSRSDWSYCSGFIAAAMQQAARGGAGTCPPVTLRQIFNPIDNRNKKYESSHSDPLYDKAGKLVGSTLHSDFIDPWSSPALPVLVDTLKSLGCQ
jgi:hypothetical protein